MAVRPPPWRPAARPARAAFPSSISALTAACICWLRHVATASASKCLRCASKSVWSAASLTTSVEPGRLSITPSGCDIAADADEDVEILVVAVDPGRMALAAAECALPEARLIERMYGEDPALLAL